MASLSRLRVEVRRKVYPGAARPALEGLALAAAPGEIVAIVGPSGSGKSTLLAIAAGLDRDLDGEVAIDGRRAYTDGPPPIRIGMVFQASRLMPWLTVLDNVRLVLAPGAESTAEARRLLSDLDLADAADAYPGQLSGGMQRRVALARACAVRPDLLLLDEPLVSVDAATAARMRGCLLELWADVRPTIVYVTHDLREALAVADRVAFLSRGPARIVLEVAVELPRPREPGDRSVAELHDRLLAAHPDLLAGLPASGTA
jgi:NitT/TauT family transport system ATP-binding protein